MIAFYQRLLKGEDRVQALRAVQFSMLNGKITAQTAASSGDRGASMIGTADAPKPDATIAGWRHPCYWAAFTASRANGPINLGRK